ncbi:MAG: hypothetical protein LW875_09355 [Proteobacteria bacterium]|nr:hypothetical protein [Pseudomonadota bacterium]
MNMRFWPLTVLSLLFVSLTSHGEIALLSGFVSKKENGYVLVEEKTSKRYDLRALNSETIENLKHLKHYDYISGYGEIKDNQVVLLESIDYVGLRRILGLWQSTENVLNFVSFRSVKIVEQLQFISDLGILDLLKEGTYDYAISPGSNGSWRVFFSDSSSVILASLTLSAKSDEARLEVYNSSTGEITKELILHKVR